MSYGLIPRVSCLVEVLINPELRVRVTRGAAAADLIRGEWKAFRVRVRNEAGTTATLHASGAHEWLEIRAFDEPAVSRTLSGGETEDRVFQLRCHESGRFEATLAFDVGQGTQDLGFRNELPILFDVTDR